MANDASEKGSELKFVHITEPGDIRSKDLMTVVRSHVTKRQHSRERQRKKESRRGSKALLKTKLKEEEDPEDEAIGTKSARDSPASASSSNSVSRAPSSGFEKAFSQGTVAFRIIALDDMANTIGMTLNQLDTDASSVLSLYDNIVKVQSGHIQKEYSTGTRPSAAHQRWMTFIFSDPIVLAMAILIGTRCLLSPAGQEVSSYHQNLLLRLKSFLINNINTALNDSRRCISNHMLICIALLASYEIKYENHEQTNYHLHMRGLVELVNMRGGLRVIGSQTEWVERILIWTDINSAKIAGCEPYFAENGDSHYQERPKANTEIYTTRRHSQKNPFS